MRGRFNETICGVLLILDKVPRDLIEGVRVYLSEIPE